MKQLFLSALLMALVLPALPGGAGVSGGVMVAQSSTTNDTSNDTDALGRGTGNRSNLTYAGQGEVTGLGVTVSGESVDATDITLYAANGATQDCAATACADAAGAASPVGEVAEARETGDSSDSVDSFNLDGDDEDLEQFITATFGEAAARTSDDPAARGSADGALVNLVLTPDAVQELPDGLVASVNSTLLSLDDALDTLPDGAELAGIDDAVSELRADIGSRALVRVRGGDARSVTRFDDGVVRAESSVDSSTITVLPTDADTEDEPDGLMIIEVGPAQTAAAANGSSRARIFSQAPQVSVTLLPGLLDVLPRDASGEVPSVDDVVRQLPVDLVALLPTNLRTPAAAADGVELDRQAAGLRVDLGIMSPRTCFLQATGLEACVLAQGTDETFAANGQGVGVLTKAVRVQMLPDETADTPTHEALFELNRTSAGAAGAFTTTSTGSSTTNNSRPTGSSQTTLPRTGGSSALVLPALGMILLSGLIMVSLRRRES